MSLKEINTSLFFSDNQNQKQFKDFVEAEKKICVSPYFFNDDQKISETFSTDSSITENSKYSNTESNIAASFSCISNEENSILFSKKNQQNNDDTTNQFSTDDETKKTDFTSSTKSSNNDLTDNSCINTPASFSNTVTSNCYYASKTNLTDVNYKTKEEVAEFLGSYYKDKSEVISNYLFYFEENTIFDLQEELMNFKKWLMLDDITIKQNIDEFQQKTTNVMQKLEEKIDKIQISSDLIEDLKSIKTSVDTIEKQILLKDSSSFLAPVASFEITNNIPITTHQDLESNDYSQGWVYYY